MDLPSQLELAARIIVAMLLGGVIGIEREINDHPAGLRTHIMVSVGAALFGIISAYGFDAFDAPRDRTTYQVDVTRVASNVVTGVGFLGGGAILKYGATVRGLTTAASLWATAAIGLGAGLGTYVVCLVTTAVVLVSLVGLRWPRRWIARRRTRASDTITVRLRRGSDPSAVIAAISQIDGVTIRSVAVGDDDRGRVVEADVVGRPRPEVEGLVSSIGERDDVEDLDLS